MNNSQGQSSKTKYEPIGDYVSIFKRNGIWYVNFMDQGKQVRRSLKTTKEKTAKSKARKIENRLQEGQGVITKNLSAHKLIQCYLEHVENDSLAKKTKCKYRRILKTVQSMISPTAAAQLLNFQFVDRYRAERLKVVCESTVYDEVMFIKQITKYGVERKLIGSNPLASYRIKEPKPKPQPCWSHQQGQQIVAESPDGVYRVAFKVLLHTGLRSAELCHLRWNDIDFEKKLIHVREKTWKEGDEVKRWRPKTGDQRVVPMSPTVIEALRDHDRINKWVFLAPASRQYPEGDNRLTSSRLLKALKRVLKKLSLEGHVHTFRHTFISHALMQGVPEAIVRSWVGHVDDDIIRQYTHIADCVSQKQMEMLSQCAEEEEGSSKQ